MRPVGRHAALVNGAGSAIGRSITASLLAGGHQVCAADADALALRALVHAAAPRRPTAFVGGRVVRAAGPLRIVALVGAPDDVDHQDDAVECALGAFGRIDLLINVIDAATVASLVASDAGRGGDPAGVASPVASEAGRGGNPAGWIEKANLAWAGEHGGVVVTVFTPSLTGDGTWPAPVAVVLSRLTADLQDQFGPGTRLTSLLPPPALAGAEAPTLGGGTRSIPLRSRATITRRSPVMPLRSPATVPDVVSYLLTRRGQGLAGRTIVAARASTPWSVVDARLPAPSGSGPAHPARRCRGWTSANAPPDRGPVLAPAVDGLGSENTHPQRWQAAQ